MSLQDRLTDALAGLLPRGYAWPREPGSVLMGVVRGWAGVLCDALDFTHGRVAGWQPGRSIERLSEWEDAAGLSGAGAVEARQAALLARLRGPELPLADSAMCAPAVLEGLCAQAGYTVAIVYHPAARYGRARCGDLMWRLNGHLIVTVTGPIATLDPLEALLRRVLPARFEPVFVVV